ncbi:MAG: tetratricopeptide repeat protein [Oscillatoria sp. PMC 1051.18]|nr:tetratricopeptide repeat protein [Oscillatoria sp. PMC 1050.18]MEC5028945.1 tetratricopeptide repeat protein [Oscillatoria sp. PMC 1051.18]
MNAKILLDKHQQVNGYLVPGNKLYNALIKRLYPIQATFVQNQQQSESDLQAKVREQVEQGKYAEAIATLSQLIARQPQNAAHYNNRGLLHFKNHQFLQALADYNQAIELDPRLDSAYNNRANYYAAVGDLAAAIADYDRALDYNPANLRARINLAIAWRELGIYDLALENLDLALMLGQRYQGRIYTERGRTYHLRGDWNCAIADYQHALSLLQNDRGSVLHSQRVQNWLNELLKPIQ